MKVLIYVLSCHEPPYGQMIQTSMDTWDRDPVPGVETKFYCGHPIPNGFAYWNSPDRIVSVPVNESYANIGYKNIEAFRRSLEWDWDFMARPNASCYVHKERLYEYCKTLFPYERVMGIMADASPQCRVDRPFLWGGGQIIVSRDVAEAIVRNAYLWRHDLMEDVALGELIQDMGYSIDNTLPSCSINKGDGDWTLIAYNGESKHGSFDEIIKDAKQFFFRIKHDPDRSVDAEVMRMLKEKL